MVAIPLSTNAEPLEQLTTTAAALSIDKQPSSELTNDKQPSEAKLSVSSRVIRKIDGWEDASLLIPHEAIRVLLGGVANLQLDTVDKVCKFNTLWKQWVYAFIHEHHEIEEETYMPWLNSRVPNPPELDIKTDHVTLVADMDAISELAKIETLEAGAKLSSMLSKFAEDMAEHLAVEETHVPGMLRKSGYTQEDEGLMIGAIMQKIPPEAFATMMPLVIYAMDLAGGYGSLTSEVFLSTLPPFIVEAMPQWMETFKTECLGTMAALQAQKDA